MLTDRVFKKFSVVSGVCLYKVWCGYIKCGVAKLSWSVAISKSDFSVSLCQFSKKRSKMKIDKELDKYKSTKMDLHCFIDY